MPIDTTHPRSRRALLVGFAGGAAALAAGVLGRPATVKADHVGFLELGHQNNASDPTYLFGAGSELGEAPLGAFTSIAAEGSALMGNTSVGDYGDCGGPTLCEEPGARGVHGRTGNATAVFGEAVGAGIAVDASANSGVAVQAVSNSGIGVRARSMSATAVDAFSSTGTAIVGESSGGYGVRGFAGGSLAGVLGVSGGGPGVEGGGQLGIGVLGSSDTNIGVKGISAEGSAVAGLAGATPGSPVPPRYTGVFGHGGTSGVHGVSGVPGGAALRGDATGGATALLATGPVDFGLASGSVQIPRGRDIRVVTPTVPMTVTSKILCSLESPQAGLSIHRVTKDLTSVPATFTVHLSDPVIGRGSRIAWFVIG